jgi:hypothetical protein
MRAETLILCFALAGCHGSETTDDSGAPQTDDSTAPPDDSTPSDDSAASCTLTVVDTSPRTEDGPWLYSDPLVVTFNEPAKAASFALTDAAGTPVAFTPTWGKGATDVSLDAQLTGSTPYTLSITACETTTSIDFTTSVYGSPLAIDPAQLVGRTYLFDLATAQYEEPPGIGALVALYVSAQVLLGVTSADASTLGLLGGQGVVDAGMFIQDKEVPTFELAGADFTDSPYFVASAEQVQIVVDDTYTLYDFSAEGTFAPDGESVGGATLSMMVDTTKLGSAMNLPDDDDPMAVCNFIEPLGIPCDPCPGGKQLDNCIAIVAHWDAAPRVAGVTLEVVVPEAEE